MVTLMIISKSTLFNKLYCIVFDPRENETGFVKFKQVLLMSCQESVFHEVNDALCESSVTDGFFCCYLH